ncbi:hypothetical protein LIER_18690 [Lithospermum erythrorhizon]|uniref:Uncharacterized protein n=1 Tax=Lithospermum erythrorhizon TaxID=34254 RepID=A0AAV3QJC3_LITER
MVEKEGSLTPEFPPGFESALNVNLNFQNSNLTKSLAIIKGAHNEDTNYLMGFNAEDRVISDPTFRHFKPTLIDHQLGSNAPIKTNLTTDAILLHGIAGGFIDTIKFFDFQNMVPTITQAEEHSLESFPPEGRRFMKGGHSKGVVKWRLETWIQRLRLLGNPSGHHEYLKLELPGFGPPLGNLVTSRDFVKKVKMPNAMIVDARGQKGGLEIKSFSTHHIEACIKDGAAEPWRLVGFYGHHELPLIFIPNFSRLNPEATCSFQDSCKLASLIHE